jgi:hypothetical protein
LVIDFLKFRESFDAKAKWDYNAPRLGYGSDKILDSNGVLRTVRDGDVTTKDNALKVLSIEMSPGGPYYGRLVGNKGKKLTQQEFDELKEHQKAALLSFVYNAGSLYTNLWNALKAKNYDLAADWIEREPVTAKDTRTGKRTILKGLQIRRKQEADLFRYGTYNPNQQVPNRRPGDPPTPPPNAQPVKPTAIAVGDGLATDLLGRYPSYVAKDDKLIKSTLPELLVAMKASAVWSI